MSGGGKSGGWERPWSDFRAFFRAKKLKTPTFSTFFRQKETNVDFSENLAKNSAGRGGRKVLKKSLFFRNPKKGCFLGRITLL